LLAGLKTALTNWRDEKWAKEMDYVYLVLGAVGLAISTNRLDIVDQKLSMPEYFGPFVLATALVVRGLKTRVEINGWNKPEIVYLAPSRAEPPSKTTAQLEAESSTGDPVSG
jgi:hypothetical protein